MSEIVPAEPVYYDAHDSDYNDRAITVSDTASTYYDRDHDHVFESFESEKVPRTLPIEIRRFLRVANLIETEESRVAYLCRFRALEVAHNTDRNLSGRGVRQFKTSLLQRLLQDEDITLRKRKEKSDIWELRRVYHAYKDYINRHGGALDLGIKDREKLMNACRIASVLFEVLKTMTNSVGHQAKYVPYNILPLDHGGIQHAIMQLPEIKASVAAVRNIRGLPLVQDVEKPGALVDIFDFLQQCFGFQEGNAANQREHLILLLANTHVRQFDKQTSTFKLGNEAIDKLMKKFFKNYTNWCKFLGRKSSIKLPYVKQEAQQYKLLYIGLYLLIWGEAANLRFMPECISYIFHHMAYELHGILTSAVSLTTWEKVEPAYRRESESFLNHVVTPIYEVIYEEAKNSNNGTADHSKWRNYDDLNEYFWSPDCFQIGWPMRLDHIFFSVKSLNKDKKKNPHSSNDPVDGKDKLIGNTDEELGDIKEENHEPKWLGKTNFVETRSFWQIYRSFDRLWNLLILCLQAMIVMACHDVESPRQLFGAVVFEDVISIFITSAFLNLVQGILDIAFTWEARNMMDYYQKIKLVLKLVLSVIWTIILPVCYAYSRRKYTCYPTHYEGWLGELCFSPYMVSVAIYLATNAVEMVLFLVPAVRKYIEISNWQIFLIFTWWTKPRLYVGRGMQESQVSVFKYTFFWILVLSSKFAFSYNFEIKPLVEPTRQIMKIGMRNYDWHEFFPEVKSNAGAIVAIWAPIIVIYFMDTQIWYSVYCTVFGGIYGILHHLGEIRTLGMLRSRFNSLPSAFNASLIPPTKKDYKRTNFFRKKDQKASDTEKNGVAKFVLVWNQIISKYRSEDLISNRELDLMTIPISPEICTGMVRWPVFLLANKFSTASSIARDFVGKDKSLFGKIAKDKYMMCAVKECYESVKYILNILVIGKLEKRVISSILKEVEDSIETSTLLENFKMSKLPALQSKCIELLELLLERNEHHHGEVVKVLQDMFELVNNDMMVNSDRVLDFLYSSQDAEADSPYFTRNIKPQLFESTATESAINFPLPNTSPLYEQIQRVLLLLIVKDKAMDVPANLEARRRISFFATSLFMDMPSAPKVRNMLSFSVITPHYIEDINYSLEELHSGKEKVPIISYMQKMNPDEWNNFLERVGCYAIKDERMKQELRNWASFRGQTLSRTVRGMMYYRDAIKLQAFLDMADNEDILVGYDEVEKNNHTLSAQLDAIADMKFTYVISCQMYGSQTEDILDLLTSYPSLRVAFVEEKEMLDSKKPKKVYSSVLVKAANGFEEIYRIKLPGPPNIGEGKPENQNNAIVFTRGEALQTIDMNQDNYLEEAFKMRNLLQEFQHHGTPPPTILGLREHIFTGSVSSLAWFMSYQETSFATIGQRILANPLRVRFHYGHPDVFDRLFHITRGGISKASKTINLSEDVFAGFNSTLRRGSVTYHEYLQVGKGRDVGLNQISKFEAKVANGNSEQTISRDLYRLARGFDYFRMMSCYYTTIGFYFSSLISVIGIYVFLYGQLYLVLSGLQKALIVEARVRNIQSLETALASQSFIQLGLLTGLPMVMEIGLEKGFLMALKDFVLMQLQLAAVFFTFSLGTKSHYYGRTILHGGAKYRPSGRKVVVFHASFTENYRLYSRSHFVKGFELLLLLVIYDLFRRSYESSMAFVLITYAIWFMSITWLFAPFLFNPSGFSWGKIVDDWKDWNKWINQQGGLGIQEDKSWQSWWNDEQAHLRRSGLFARLIEILLSLRFFIYQYGLVYHLDISKQNKNFLVYALSWVVILAMFLLVKTVSMGRKLFSARYQLVFRLFKAFLFLGVLATIIALSVACDLSSKDLIVCCLAFFPTGWGWIMFAQAIRPKIEHTGLWEFTQVLAKSYDFGMGMVLLAPVAILAWLPIIQAFHFQFLFNEAFNRHLQIQQILSDKTKNK